jgi:Ion channel
MIALATIAGIALVTMVLWEAFEAVVLPRRATRRFRLNRLFYRSTWPPWRAVARSLRPTLRETLLSFYGPLSLLFLFVLWASLVVLGFGILEWAMAPRAGAAHAPLNFITCLYLSGTTFFTLGLGDVSPTGWPQRWLTVVESGLGFGFFALVFSYLPVIYQAFSRREVNIVLLDARAGSPPTAAELLRRHAGEDGWRELQQILNSWERASADILESHVSYPAVAYFRSQHNNESWIAALAAILDTSALLVAGIESDCARQARLTFAMCRHTVVDLAQLFTSAPVSGLRDRLPAPELLRLRATLADAGYQLRDTEAANEKLRELRGMYEPYLACLSRFLLMEVPPWILPKEVLDNWRTTAWGRISGMGRTAREELSLDDHSH